MKGHTMKTSDPWKTRWLAAVSVAWIVLLFAATAALTGCANVAGRLHSPLVGLQYERALRAAEESGYARARTECGTYRWLAGGEAQQYRAARDAALEAGQPLPAVSIMAGQTDDEIVAQTYPTWLRWAAKLGDGAIYALATWGAAKAADELNSDSGGGADYRDRRDVSVSIPGSGNNVNVNIGQYSDGQQAGNTAAAEGAAQ